MANYNRKFWLTLGIILIAGGYLIPGYVLIMNIIKFTFCFTGGVMIGHAIAQYFIEKYH